MEKRHVREDVLQEKPAAYGERIVQAMSAQLTAWLEKNDTRPGEAPLLGLNLCAEKSEEHVEPLQLDKSGIRVAQYPTELPSRELLEKTLYDSIRRPRERLLIV